MTNLDDLMYERLQANSKIIELRQIIEGYEKALKKINYKGSPYIRGNVANELAEIARKALEGYYL